MATKRKPRVMIACACGCGATFENRSESGRERRYLPGHRGASNPWTSAEDDYFRRRLAETEPHTAQLYAEIGTELGRSATAIRRRAEEQGLTSFAEVRTVDAGELTRLFNADRSVAEIAKAMGFSIDSIRKNLDRLGLRAITPQEQPKAVWTDEERANLIDLVNAGFTSARIAAKLGRTKASIKRMREKLRREVP